MTNLGTPCTVRSGPARSADARPRAGRARPVHGADRHLPQERAVTQPHHRLPAGLRVLRPPFLGRLRAQDPAAALPHHDAGRRMLTGHHGVPAPRHADPAVQQGHRPVPARRQAAPVPRPATTSTSGDWTNLVLIITRFKVTAADMAALEALRNLRVTLLFTYSGITDPGSSRSPEAASP